MAFCKYCGNQLQDGESCTCEKAVAAQQAAATPVAEPVAQEPAVQETAAPAQEPAATAQPATEAAQGQVINGGEILDKAKEISAGVLGKFLAFWKKPAEETVAFTKNGKNADAFIFMAVQAILSGLLVMAQLGKMGATITASIKESLGGLVSEDMLKLDLPYGEGFIYFVLASAGISLLFVVLFFAATRILKVQASGMQLVRYASLRSVAAIPFTLLAIILTFINQGLGLVVNLLAVIFSYTYLMQGADAMEELDKNKKGYMVAIVNTVALAIVIFIVCNVIETNKEEILSKMTSFFGFY